MTARVGIIGCGAWGRNYLRIFQELRVAGLVAVDAHPASLAAVRERHPQVETLADSERLLKREDVDAVVIATPASTHYSLAARALKSGKHVLVEKPMATSVADAERLVATQKESKRILMVGHTFLHNDSVRKFRELVREKATGRIYYLQARRNHLGPIRPDVNVFWDLAPHDLSIFRYVLDRDPEWVSAVGSGYLKPGREDVVFATLGYPGGVLGHIQVSWIDSNKVREVAAIGSRRRIVFDDLNLLESVRIYEKGAAPLGAVDSYGEFQYQLRDGDILSPKIERHEPLRNECQHFLECIRTGRRPLSDGEGGATIVRTLVAVDRSLRSGGKPVRIGGRGA